jgi:hypothetical protein
VEGNITTSVRTSNLTGASESVIVVAHHRDDWDRPKQLYSVWVWKHNDENAGASGLYSSGI